MTSNDLAISVRGLGKRYRRNTKARNDSLRDAMKEGVNALLRKGDKNASQTFWALSDASFDIKKGENVGIIGLNGAGKSTLLKLLSRITTPTTGEARINGRLGALLEVGTGFHQELTGRENTYLYGAILGMSRAEVASKFDAIIDFAEIEEFIDTPVKRYSSGMYVRLAFAVAAHLDPDILLLDEVLAVGDFAFQRKCMNFARSLEKKGSTILFVSHNMFSIKTMCERVIYLRKGQVVYDGPTDAGLRIYEADSRLKAATWFSDDQAAGAIAITDVKLMDDQGREAGMFDFGQRMRVRVEYKTTREIEQPDFRVGINRADDIHCLSFSTIADQVEIPSVNGEGVIELRTPPISLVSDLYSLTVSVRERGYGRTLTAQIGGHFHVRHPVFASNAFGVYHEAGQWVLPNSAANDAKRGAATADVKHEHG
jgi:lipopolysaccharide transport system ATP-binding protein